MQYSTLRILDSSYFTRPAAVRVFRAKTRATRRAEPDFAANHRGWKYMKLEIYSLRNDNTRRRCGGQCAVSSTALSAHTRTDAAMGDFDAGSVFFSDQGRDQGRGVAAASVTSPAHTKLKFREFLRGFREGETYVYRHAQLSVAHVRSCAIWLQHQHSYIALLRQTVIIAKVKPRCGEDL
eukprot:5138749-Pleurochrysis_carterae.AAC.2